MNLVKRITVTLILLCSIVPALTAYASSPRQTGVRARTYSAERSSSARSASRPYYGGGKHTASHGGTYRAGGSSHKGGHYTSAIGSHHYGRHK